MIVSETWFKCTETDIFNIDGYTSMHSCRASRPSGGLSIYIRSPCKIVNVEMIANSINAISIALANYKRMNNLQVIGVYRPPDAGNYNLTMKTIEDLLSKKKLRKVILCGDLNVNVCESNMDGRATAKNYLNTMKSLSMNICNNIITRESSQSVIDHVFSSFVEQTNHCVDTIRCSSSDHNILITKISVYNAVNAERIKRKTDYVLLNQLLTERLATDFPNTNDVNTQLNSLIDCIKRSTADSTTTKTVEASHKKMCEWISNSPNIMRLIHQKNNLWKKQKLNVRYNRCNEQTLKHITDIETKLTVLKKEAKENYYADRFSNCANSKETWKTINEIISTGKKRDKQNIRVVIDGVEVDEAAVSNSFAHHFSTVGKALADSIEVRPNDSHEDTALIPWNEHSIFLKPASEDEIFSLIRALGANKAAGIDQIQSTVVKNCAITIAPVLTKIINDSLASGIFPDALKIARVVPVFKGGNMDQVGNYRPISVLYAEHYTNESCTIGSQNSWRNTKFCTSISTAFEENVVRH